MDIEKIEKLLEMINEVVGSSGSWKTKREAVLAEASDSDKTNLEEFSSWFQSLD